MRIRQKGDLARFAVKEEDKASVSTTPVKGQERPTKAQKRRLLRPDKNLKLSTTHLHDLACEGIACEGLKVVEERPDGEALHGWLEFQASDVIGLGLKVEYDKHPPRHVHVVNWPTISGDRMFKELRLAERCAPHLVDPPKKP